LKEKRHFLQYRTRFQHPECDSGDFVISGGFKFVFPGNELGNPFVTASEPTTTLDGWSATIINIDSNTIVGIVGIAVCLDAS